jgi:hypothetical protein
MGSQNVTQVGRVGEHFYFFSNVLYNIRDPFNASQVFTPFTFKGAKLVKLFKVIP